MSGSPRPPIRCRALARCSLVEMATSGRLHTPVAGVFDAARVRQAYEHFGTHHGRGRTVLSFT
jgi:hypothetical protein